MGSVTTPLLKLIPGMQKVHGQMVMILSLFTERLNRPLISRDMQVLRGDLDINKLTIFDTYARRVRNCTISVIPLIESTTRVQLLRLKSGLLPMLTSLVLSGRQLLCFKNEFSAFVPLILQSRSFPPSPIYLSLVTILIMTTH